MPKAAATPISPRPARSISGRSASARSTHLWSALLPASAITASLLAVSACGESQGAAQSGGPANDRPVVLTTFTVLEDMVAEVGGDAVDVRSIAPHGAEVHEYEPTPGDLRDAEEADLIIENGLGLEEWYGQFIEGVDAESVTVTEQITPRGVTRAPGHPDDDGETEQMPTDPHAWTSPVLSAEYIDAIEEALTELSGDDAETFAANAEAYRAELADLTEATDERAAQIDEDVHVVTCEGAFGYLAEDLGLEEHYLWPLNADGEGTPQQVEAQIRYVEDNEVPTVFCESTVNDSAQRQVAEATGADLGDPLHVDSLTEPDGPVPTHLELLAYDIDLILSAAEEAAQ